MDLDRLPQILWPLAVAAVGIALAAVAFVVKRDRKFRLEFLDRVVGIPRSDLDHGFHLEPQKAFYADLAITDETNNKRYGRSRQGRVYIF
jgi:hypothetical protein